MNISSKCKSIFLQVIMNPFFHAFILSMAIILFTFPWLPKYQFTITENEVVDKKDGYMQFADIDGDGYSEELIAFNNTEGQASIRISDGKGILNGHWYFNGKLIPRGELFFHGSPDNSDTDRVFICIQRDDSLFLNIVCSDLENQYSQRDIFLSEVKSRNGNYDYQCSNFNLADLNNDGCKELIFEVMAGYPLRPRSIYAYDLKNDLLTSSPPSAAYLNINAILDINNDTFPEILCASNAIHNFPDDSIVPFHDSCAWLTVFDHNLNYLFRPIGFPGYTSHIYAVIYKKRGETYLAAILNQHRNLNFPVKIFLFNANGQKIKERNLFNHQKENKVKSVMLFTDESQQRLYIRQKDGEIIELDSNLDTLRSTTLFYPAAWPIFTADVISDRSVEVIWYSQVERSIVISPHDLSQKLNIPFVGSVHGNIKSHFGLKLNGENPPEAFFQGGNDYILFRYFKNPYYPLKYPAYLGLYLLILGIILLIRKIQRVQLQKKYETEKQICDLQLRLVRSQVDPHFIFNALNSIGASIYKENKDEAYGYLNQFSSLIRNHLDNTRQIHRSLNSELLFVSDFLNLEKFRFKDHFDFRINLPEGMRMDVQIPKMSVLTYVENAVKHGLRGRAPGGMITIGVEQNEKQTTIVIEDNGIGRKQAGENRNSETSTGTGIRVMNDFFDTLNRFNEEKIRVKIEDLTDGQDKPLGTRVILYIPNHFSYDFKIN